MRTKPLYLEDPYIKEINTIVIDVFPDEQGVFRVVLDQTIFYPLGGGQPTDQGTLSFADGSTVEVYKVLLQEGEICHYIRTDHPPSSGDKVKAIVDWTRRLKNMKVHTAAHIIDFALATMGYVPQILQPLKGDCGKKPHILYDGIVNEDIKEALQKQVNDMIAKNMKFSWSFEQLTDLEKEALYLQPGLPKNKPLRALRLEGVGTVADGGTIFATTQEVGQIVILSIEQDGKETTVRFNCL